MRTWPRAFNLIFSTPYFKLNGLVGQSQPHPPMMKLVNLLCFGIFLASFTPQATGQKIMFSLHGGASHVLESSEILPDLKQTFYGAYIGLGFEGKLARHLTIGAEFDKVFLEPELAVTEPISQLSQLPPVLYSIHRKQLNVQAVYRYYFIESFRGPFAGIFASVGTQKQSTQDYPMTSGYYPEAYVIDDLLYWGGGVTYGWRFKVLPALRISATGSHHFMAESKIKQVVNQFGIGLNFIL